MVKNQKSKIKCLKVEPFQLMHTGNFYGFLVNSWKDISPDDVVYFGISTSEFPETNCSISSYIHDERISIYPIHHTPEHQATAVYKRGYHSRLNLSNKRFHEHMLDYWIKMFRGKKMPLDFFGDQGLKSKARDIYRVSEIEALICYDLEDIQLYQEAILQSRNRIPIYREVENPDFTNQFNQKFVLIRYDDSNLEHHKKIIIPDSFERLKDLSKQLEIRVNEDIEGLKRWYKVSRESSKSSIRISIRENQRLLQTLQKITEEGKIPIPEKYQERARVLFSRFTREIGVPRYLYILSL